MVAINSWNSCIDGRIVRILTCSEVALVWRFYFIGKAHGTKGAANPDIYIHPPPELESQPPSTSYSSMHMNGFNHPSFNHDKSIAENTSPTCSTNLPPVSFYMPHSPDTA